MALGAVAVAALVELFGIREALLAVAAVLPLFVVLRWRRLRAYEVGAPVAERHFMLLRADSIFAPLSLATLERLTHDLIEVAAEPGQEVITQGDFGDRFYLIEAGEVEVLEAGVHRRYQRPGESFGEIALLRGEPRTATVRATEPTRLLALDRDRFIAAVTGHRRSSEAADSVIAERLRARPARLRRCRRAGRGARIASRPEYPLGMPEATRARAPKRIILAAPRGYCAGVDRAVQTVEKALDMYGPPVYVRKEIVHNKHVVEQARRARCDLRRGGDRGARGRAGRLLGPRRRPERPRELRRAQPADDRRHLPAGDQGPRRGAQVRRGRLHDRADRPPGPRGGRGDDGRGAREHRPGRDGRRRRRARAPRPRPRRLHHPDDALGRRDRRDHRPAARALPEHHRRRSRTTSVTRPPTARSRSSSSPASASSCS